MTQKDDLRTVYRQSPNNLIHNRPHERRPDSLTFDLPIFLERGQPIMRCSAITANAFGYIPSRRQRTIPNMFEKGRLGIRVSRQSALVVTWSFHYQNIHSHANILIGRMSDRETTKWYQSQ